MENKDLDLNLDAEGVVADSAGKSAVKRGATKESRNRSMPIMLAILVVLFVAAMGFGVFMIFRLGDREARISELEAELAGKDDGELGQAGGMGEFGDDSGDGGAEKGENDGWVSLVVTPEKWLNRGSVGLDETRIVLSSGTVGVRGEIQRGYSATSANDCGEFYPIDSKTNVTVDWDEVRKYFPNETVEGKTGTETFDISGQIEPGRVVEIQAHGFGQAVSVETLFFLMDDGTIEYIPVVQIARTGEVKSAGKLPGVEKVITLSAGSGMSYGGCGGHGVDMHVKRSDGGVYSLGGILGKTGKY